MQHKTVPLKHYYHHVPNYPDRKCHQEAVLFKVVRCSFQGYAGYETINPMSY